MRGQKVEFTLSLFFPLQARDREGGGRRGGEREREIEPVQEREKVRECMLLIWQQSLASQAVSYAYRSFKGARRIRKAGSRRNYLLGDDNAGGWEMMTFLKEDASKSRCHQGWQCVQDNQRSGGSYLWHQHQLSFSLELKERESEYSAKGYGSDTSGFRERTDMLPPEQQSRGQSWRGQH